MRVCVCVYETLSPCPQSTQEMAAQEENWLVLLLLVGAICGVANGLRGAASNEKSPPLLTAGRPAVVVLVVVTKGGCCCCVGTKFFLRRSNPHGVRERARA